MDGNHETPQSPEVFSTAKQTVALQARLLIGAEALDPNNLKLQKVSSEGLKDISQETFNKLSVASTNERVDYWKNKADSDPSLNTYEAQMKSWAMDVVKFINDPNFTEKNALDLYNKFFTGDNKISAVDKYVNSFVDGFQAQFAQINVEINIDQLLVPTLEKIRLEANIFGANSAEFIEASIRAKLNLLYDKKKQEFINQVNEEKIVGQNKTIRLDYLNPNEERLLKWLNENSKTETLQSNPKIDLDDEDDLKIKIIKSATPEELITIISENVENDEPIIIEVDEPPEKKDFNIISDADAEKKLRRERFTFRNNINENTDITDLVPVYRNTGDEDDLFYFSIRQKQLDGSIQYSCCFVMKDENDKIIPVGHVDYSTNINNPKEATAMRSTIDNIIGNIDHTKVTPDLKVIYDHFCPEGKTDVAVRVDDRFRGKNFGSLLWNQALTQADLEGIEEINIVGDLTSDIKKQGDSFYKHLGAQTMLMVEKIDDQGDETITTTRLFSPTFLPLIQKMDQEGD